MNTTHLLANRWLITPRGWIQAIGSIEKAAFWAPMIKAGRPVVFHLDRESVIDSGELPDGSQWQSVERVSSTRGYNLFDEPIQGMEIEGGIAKIPVYGVLLKGADIIDKTFGFTDPDDVRADYDAAQADAGVQEIELHFDSPGGTVSGIPGLAKHIANGAKRTRAIADGQLCSAAYWLAAGCYSIEATIDSDVGSIGVYQPMEDYSRMYKAAGIDVELLKTGKYKGACYPGVPITDEQKAHFQSEVDEIGEWFFSHVTSNRKGVKPDSMQGQSFLAEEAFRRGLVDIVTG
jgi:ClpP class serine protease